jgi:hypothetical protein
MVFNAISTIFQSYRGSQFYWRKPEYPEKTTDLFKSLTNFITYCWIEYASRVGFELTSTDCTQVDVSPTTIQYDYDHDGSFIPGHTTNIATMFVLTVCVLGVFKLKHNKGRLVFTIPPLLFIFFGGLGVVNLRTDDDRWYWQLYFGLKLTIYCFRIMFYDGLSYYLVFTWGHNLSLMELLHAVWNHQFG